MKALHGSASSELTASPERCFALLAAIDEYPRWHPDVVRDAAVLERGPDGLPVRARATLHAALGPLVRDFHVEWTVSADPPRRVRLARIPHGGGDQERLEVAWRVVPGPLTRIEIELTAELSVPRLLPVGGLGDMVANGFVAAADRELGSSS